jgi:flagellar hook-length control protein FliK
MNAIPSVSYLTSDAAGISDPAAPGDGASANSTARSANGQDFAAALTSAGPKPARKSSANKVKDGTAAGGQLPVAGNPSPPQAPPAAASKAATAASSVNGVTTGAAVPGAARPARAPAADSGSSAAGLDAADEAGSGASPGADMARVLALAAAQADASNQDATASIGNAAGLAAAALSARQQSAVGADPAGAANPGVNGAPATAASALTGLSAMQNVADASASSAGASATAIAIDSKSIADTSNAAAAPVSRTAGSTAEAKSAGNPAEAKSSGAGNQPGSAVGSGRDGNPVASANAGPSATSGAWTNGDAWAGSDQSDAALQTAAAIAAAPTDTIVSPPTDVSSAPTDAITPAGGAVAGGSAVAGGNAVAGAAGGLGGPIPAQPAALGNRPAMAAAGAPVHAAAALSAANTADKHTAGGGDSQLPGSPGDGAAAAAQLNPGAGATDAAAPTMKVAAGVETPEFGQGLAERVSWMAGNNLNGAKLQVNPAQLGPIEVRIAVQGDHAQVWLTSHSAITRDALESSSPKLREMLGAQGFGQVSVDISQRSFQDRPAHAQPYDWSAGNGGSATPDTAVHATGSLPRATKSALDAYA